MRTSSGTSVVGVKVNDAIMEGFGGLDSGKAPKRRLGKTRVGASV